MIDTGIYIRVGDDYVLFEDLPEKDREEWIRENYSKEFACRLISILTLTLKKNSEN